MAEALARGFVAGKLVKAEDIVATDPMEARVKVFSEFGAKTVQDNAKASHLKTPSFVCCKCMSKARPLHRL